MALNVFSCSGINRDLQSLTQAEESEGELSEGDATGMQNVQTLPGGKFYRQMSEQPHSSSARKTKTYPPKEASPDGMDADSVSPHSVSKPKPPQRSKVQVGTLEVHNVKKAINR